MAFDMERRITADFFNDEERNRVAALELLGITACADRHIGSRQVPQALTDSRRLRSAFGCVWQLYEKLVALTWKAAALERAAASEMPGYIPADPFDEVVESHCLDLLLSALAVVHDRVKAASATAWSPLEVEACGCATFHDLRTKLVEVFRSGRTEFQVLSQVVAARQARDSGRDALASELGTGDAGPVPLQRQRSRKTRTPPDESRMLWVSALAEYHGYDASGEPASYAPISVTDLARRSRISKASCSRLFKQFFGTESVGGYRGYTIACGKRWALRDVLRRLQDDSPLGGNAYDPHLHHGRGDSRSPEEGDD